MFIFSTSDPVIKLTFTTLWANSEDYRQIDDIFLIFP